MEISVVNKDVVSIKTQNPRTITGVLDRSRQISNDEVWVKFALGEMHILKNMGFNMPSPITYNYKYTGRYKPFEHQKTTAEFLTLNKRAYCFNEQGTGKTNAVIWAADYLLTMGIIKRVLIIAPLSILDAAWRKDLFKTVMHRSVDIAHGTREKRASIINNGAEFVIINYDGVEIAEKAIVAGGFDLVVLDEANFIKNPQTNRWKAINRIITPDTWLYMLTGTPAAQSPVDAYGLAKMMRPASVPRAFNAFRDMVQIKQSMFTYTNRPEAAGIVHSILQPAIRFTKEECLDLPELLYQTREVPLSIQQEKYYKMLKKEMLIEAGGSEISAANAAVAMNKLLQLSSGCAYSDDGEVIEFDIKGRTQELLDIVEEASHKVIVFVMFRHTIELVQKALEKAGHTVATIHGGIPVTKRNKIFSDFQSEKDPRILVIQPQAAAHGVTLHAANLIVWWGITMSLETYIQANARIHRAGQVNACNVVHLVGSAVEKRVLSVLENKGTLQTRLLDLYREVLQ